MQIEIVSRTGITPEQLAASGTENGEQKALFAWAALNIARYPQLEWLHAIPNGGLREPRTAALLKAMGAKRGVPDIFLPVPIGPWHGLYIELKRREGVVPKSGKKRREGGTSDEQDRWLAYLQGVGYGAITVVGWEAARNTLVQYLEWQS
jgi:hypothetical protein